MAEQHKPPYKSSYRNMQSKKTEERDNVAVVVAIDFGTTFSGFAYAHVTEKDLSKVTTNDA
ncbi:2396_t:CDS:2, partial [Paraglomus occultum]